MKFANIACLTSFLCLTTVNNVYANDFTFVESILGSPTSKVYNPTTSIDLSNLTCYNGMKCKSKYTLTFYQQNPQKRLWINGNEINSNGISLIKMLEHSYYEGLDPKRYQVDKLASMLVDIQGYNQKHIDVPENILFNYEVSLTDSYLTYSNDVQNGVINPNNVYEYWRVDKRSTANIYSEFINAVNSNRLIQSLQNDINEHPKLYSDLKNQLAIYINAYQQGGWKPIKNTGVLKLGSSSNAVALIKQRLSMTKQYNLSNDNNPHYFNSELQNVIKQYQVSNGLKATGIVDSSTLKLLNQSPEVTIKKIAINMDRMRWLPDSLASRRLWINIPSYQLQIYENNNLTYTMPVIVGGGKENKTCSTISSVTSIELNPYWGVPNRIATKEYLKKIQESSGYLANHDMKIYKNGSSQEIDPTMVDWSNVNEKNFNYYIKQQPGKKNALGQYKFRFDNGCGIYLHDTANRGLFTRGDRSLSHGCIRVGQPKYLAEYLTNSNTNGYTFNKVSQLVNDQTHKFVSLSKPIDVYIVYYTSYVDLTSGQLTFKKDIYDLDSINFPISIPMKKEDEIESSNE